MHRRVRRSSSPCSTPRAGFGPRSPAEAHLSCIPSPLPHTALRTPHRARRPHFSASRWAQLPRRTQSNSSSWREPRRADQSIRSGHTYHEHRSPRAGHRTCSRVYQRRHPRPPCHTRKRPLSVQGLDSGVGAIFPGGERTQAEDRPFDVNTRSFVYGLQPRAIQGMHDFDYSCGRETPSVAAMIYPFGGHHTQKFYWGTKETLLPVLGQPLYSLFIFYFYFYFRSRRNWV